MIGRVLPSAVCWSQAFHDRDDIRLFPQEQAVLTDAVRQRRAEFITVRACARDALIDLGCPRVPLVPGEGGAPVWPEGVVGSMTHCAGYRAAAVARSREIPALGIDAEPHSALPATVLEAIARPEELACLAKLPTGTGTAWDRLLFSAKESVYKVWFPLARRGLDFHEASIDIAPDGTFSVRLLVPGPSVSGRRLSQLRGRWLVDNGVILTAIAVTEGEGRVS